jgi:hypothetical protein
MNLIKHPKPWLMAMLLASMLMALLIIAKHHNAGNIS